MLVFLFVNRFTCTGRATKEIRTTEVRVVEPNSAGHQAELEDWWHIAQSSALWSKVDVGRTSHGEQGELLQDGSEEEKDLRASQPSPQTHPLSCGYMDADVG